MPTGSTMNATLKALLSRPGEICVSPLVGMWTAAVLGFFSAMYLIYRLHQMNISIKATLQALLSRLVEICQCPIDREVMDDPVTVDAPCRHTVGREPATMWYRLGHLTCPLCGVRANSPNLSPNVQAREVVEEIRRIQGGHEEHASQAPVARTKRVRGRDGVLGTYVGELDANGLRHGEGKMTLDDGCVYDGEWQNDKRHGQGTTTYPDGAKYVGGYQNGKAHGHGAYQWANSASYEGEWKKGEKHGQGTHKWPNGDKYVGGWKADKMSGVGTYYFNSGRVQISQWEEDKEFGEGVQWSADRQTAWQLSDGKLGRKIDLSAATAIASRLGFSEVP